MTFEEARTLADLRNKELLATDFNDAVEVVHQDGSTFHYKGGVLEAHGKFLYAFSEHHHPDVFFLADLKRWGFIK